MGADLPNNSSPKAPAPGASSDLNWGGFFAGGHIGYGWKSFKPQIPSSYAVTGETDHKQKGMLEGFTVGYNIQSGNIVYGLEANASVTQIKGSATNSLVYPGYGTVVQTQSSSLKDLYNVRARLGYATGPVLIYLAAGYGAGHVDSNFAVSALGQTVKSSVKAFHQGYSLAVGSEYQIAKNWSVRAGLSYFNLGSETHQGIKHTLHGQVFRTGFNYHF